MKMKSPINIGVVGATGMVGESFLNLIEKRNFPFGDVRLFTHYSGHYYSQSGGTAVAGWHLCRDAAAGLFSE